MHIYGPTQLHGPQSIGAPHASRESGRTPPPGSSPISDELEISDAARLTDQVGQIPDVRQGRVDAIRAKIADGTYETEEKLDIALERLLDEIG